MFVIAYCAEEVDRQGHDTATSDGIIRTAWMLEAWCAAISRAEYTPELFYIEELGKMVERDKNREGFRICGVKVGNYTSPPYTDVTAHLVLLLSHWNRMTPLEVYRRFEEIHPFIDGNGRVGKILLNWRAGTLLRPTFPPDDFWGVPIRNP
jgi:hypothetical protein